GVFVEVNEQFYEKLDVPLDVKRREDKATVDDDTLRGALDLEGPGLEWVTATLDLWDEFLKGLGELQDMGFVRLSVSACRLPSPDLRISRAKFVQALALHRRQRSKAAALSRSTAPPSPDGWKAPRRAGAAGPVMDSATLRVHPFQSLARERHSHLT